mmetsp:Transcript_3927/g.9587  ORF Transcript_3927/g.9587 Transcript_3927/m.9587 type:complete len:280 (-) Transcript_3927:2-841(-)
MPGFDDASLSPAIPRSLLFTLRFHPLRIRDLPQHCYRPHLDCPPRRRPLSRFVVPLQHRLPRCCPPSPRPPLPPLPLHAALHPLLVLLRCLVATVLEISLRTRTSEGVWWTAWSSFLRRSLHRWHFACATRTRPTSSTCISTLNAYTMQTTLIISWMIVTVAWTSEATVTWTTEPMRIPTIVTDRCSTCGIPRPHLRQSHPRCSPRSPRSPGSRQSPLSVRLLPVHPLLLLLRHLHLHLLLLLLLPVSLPHQCGFNRRNPSLSPNTLPLTGVVVEFATN